MKSRAFRTLASILAVVLLCSCNVGAASPHTVIELQLTEGYDDADPFVNEKLFYVSEAVETLDLEVSIKTKSSTCTLEIADNESDELLWTRVWEGSYNSTAEISLRDLSPEKEYVVRLTATHVKSTHLRITTDSSLVGERERPQKPDRD